MNRNAMGVAFVALAYLAIRDGVFTASSSGRAAAATPSGTPTSIPAPQSGVTITLLNADLSDAMPPTTIRGDAPHIPAIREIHYSFCKS